MEVLELFARVNSLKIIHKYSGHISLLGCSSGKKMNPHLFVENVLDPDENLYYIMLCNKNAITFFSEDDYDKVFSQDENNLTYSYNSKIGYIFKTIDKDKKLYLHQIIMGHSGFGKGQISIDHINRNKLDNRKCNLRLATQSEQNKNRGKVSRKSNAKELPTEFIEWLKRERDLDNLPKFCEYYLNPKEKKEFFIISKHHPLLQQKRDKFKISSKCGTCGEYSIIDKYIQIEKAFLFLESKKDFPIDSWSIDELKESMF